MFEAAKHYKQIGYILAVVLLLCAFPVYCAAETTSVTGTVTSGGSAISGATVTLGSFTTTTSGSGAYQFDGIDVGSSIVVRASADGRFAQKKYRTVVSGSNVVDFDLVAAGNNRVKNPGFDDNTSPTAYPGLPNYWSTDNSGFYVRESWPGEAGYDTSFFHSGEEAAAFIADNMLEEGNIYQDVPVKPSSNYTASVWAHVHGNPSVWGTDTRQQTAFFVTELDQYGQQIGDTKWVDFDLNNCDEWQHLTIPEFTTSPTTRLIRIGSWAVMVDQYYIDGNVSRATYDDFELSGPDNPPPPALSGYVMSGSTPLVGATVEVTGTGVSTTTGADGYYEIYGVSGSGLSVRASLTGYYAARQSANAYSKVDFDLVPTNLVVHAGFEDMPTNFSWGNSIQSWTINQTWSYANYGTWVGGAEYAHTGNRSVALIAPYYNDPAVDIVLYQDIAVMPSSDYSASVWARTRDNGMFWGLDPNQQGGLYLKEYDASNNEVADHSVWISDFTTWQELATGTFQSTSTTVRIRIGGIGKLVSGTWGTENEIVFDDFVLNGASGDPVIKGHVVSGSVPVAGTTVEVIGTSATATTDANGYYELRGASGSGLTVRASKDGYYASRQSGSVPSTTDFDLAPANMIQHAGFEDMPLSFSWGNSVDSWSLNQSWSYTNYGTWLGGSSFAHTGRMSLALIAPYGGASASYILLYQDIPVQAGANYAASAWARTRDGQDGNYFWGVDPNQTGGLYVAEMDSSDSVLADHSVSLSSYGSWQQLVRDEFQTNANTAKIRVGGFASLVNGTWGTENEIVFDDFSLTMPCTVGAVKSLPEHSNVAVSDAVVSAAFSNFFYIEAADRSSGIKVTGTATAGSTVSILGNVETVNGEKQITASKVTPTGTGTVPAPLGMNNKSTTSKLDATGLLVKVWGRVGSGGNVFTISDGGSDGVKVYGPVGYTAPAGSYVSVIGALGAELSGETAVPVVHAVSVN